jgi:hypothetical protein
LVSFGRFWQEDINSMISKPLSRKNLENFDTMTSKSLPGINGVKPVFLCAIHCIFA